MATWIAHPRPGLAEGALDDIGTLLRQLQAARDSHAVSVVRCSEMSQRLLALQEVVLTCGGSTAMLRARLSDGDPELALAVAIVALLMPEAGEVLGDAVAALPPTWWPMIWEQAFLQRRQLRVRLPSASSPSSPSAWVLARIAELQSTATTGQYPSPAAVIRALSDPVPVIRSVAWRIIGRRGLQVEDHAARRGIQDDDALVRHACAETLVWLRHPLFARLLGEAFKRRAPADHEMLVQWGRLVPYASVGPLLSVAVPPDQGLRRIELLSAIALPSVIPELLRWMESRDPVIAVAAGQAFRLMTGTQVDSAQRVVLPPPDAEASTPSSSVDVIDVELHTTGWLPDHQRAKAIWSERWSRADPERRLSGGILMQDESAAEAQLIATAQQRSAAMRRTYFHGEARPRNRL